jgi:protein N-lysine methyltransferase METTL21D
MPPQQTHLTQAGTSNTPKIDLYHGLNLGQGIVTTTTTEHPCRPPGPVTLSANATSVSDVDEEIFHLYTRLAALKPPDSSDIGHFHGLGSENSKEDALLVRIELKPPPTTYEPQPAQIPETLSRNTGRRNRARKRKGSGSNTTVGHGGQCEPIVLEYKLFQDTTALRSRSGDTGSVLWKARCAFLLVTHSAF